MGQCKICGHKTKLIVDFGKKPLANAYLNKATDKEFYYNLLAVFCPHCFMVQVGKTVKPELVFNDNYHFVSSTSKFMVEHFHKLAQEIIRKVKQKNNPFIVELGSNDGVMLKHLAKKGIKHLGVEPSANVAAMARKNKVKVKVDFFNAKTAKKIVNDMGQADIIFGANVFCHIEDIKSVFQGVNILLKNNGIFFFEDPYLLDVMKKTAFDQIYADHAYYYSALSVSGLANMHNMQIYDMKHQSVHGGSMRYYLQKIGEKQFNQRAGVEKWLKKEKQKKLNKVCAYKDFAKKVDAISQDFKSLILKIKRDGHMIVGYGATAKSSTMLNHAGIGPELIDYIIDNTPEKIGKYTPGMHIPIKSRRSFIKDKPKYTVLFAWNHKKEIFTKEAKYRQLGGRFIKYIPKLSIV